MVRWLLVRRALQHFQKINPSWYQLTIIIESWRRLPGLISPMYVSATISQVTVSKSLEADVLSSFMDEGYRKQ
jgi:hypothetical protein